MIEKQKTRLWKENLVHFLTPYPKVAISERQLELLAEHFELLLKWNKVHNLIAVEDPQALAAEHYADCVVALSLWYRKEAKGKTIYDLGSGNGFPGLIGSILFSEDDFILVESSRKKCSFLRMAIAELGLKNVKVTQERVESLREIEVAISRAAFSETKINQLSQSFAPQGTLALMTVPSFPPKEWLLGNRDWKLSQRLSYALETGAQRSVVVLEKPSCST